MGKYRKILVAIDGSESSKNALKQAIKLANDEKCWITVVSVVPPYEGELELVGVKNIRAAIRKPCEDALVEAEKISETEGRSIKTVCEEGEPHERIVDLADAENCDLIIMGRRGLRRLERVLVGSVTARVIGYTHKDVLVVPRDTTIDRQRILIATDGSKYSKTAIEKAIDFAKSYGGELKVISVVDVPPEFYAESPKTVDEMIKKAKGYVEDVKKQAEAEGVKAEQFIREGESYQVITNIAREQNVGTIVMGSHGRTGLKRLLMGSVTEKVIGHSPCPVLIVKT
ncbi:MAG TPA: universal stress protein [Thermodesulfovibrionia bacterium]|nr:universal stress protein [Thermodesulfovibrionia bacterium]